MSEKVTLTRAGLAIIALLLVAGALATAMLLHYLAGAPLPLVMLMTCVSPAALILLLYVGYRIRTRPEKTEYLSALKLLGLAGICMGVMIFVDFLLPAKTIHTNVQAMIPRGDHVELQLGRYEQNVGKNLAKKFFEGRKVTLEVTSLFDRIESVRLGRDTVPLLRRQKIGKVVMLIAGLVCLVPLMLFRLKLRPETPLKNMTEYFLVIVPSYIVSLISIGVWIKLFLVHVFGVIDTM